LAAERKRERANQQDGLTLLISPGAGAS